MKKISLKTKYDAAIEVIKDLQRDRCQIHNCATPNICRDSVPYYIVRKIEENNKRTRQ